ncbi:MAG: hypothetical protein O3A10_12210 [Chloroflexi bacterium]|nr:hypothetical protein [Chloroflexota bacterium]MDA1147641.1 hypothetical protein [Chloroflexota bacterium]
MPSLTDPRTNIASRAAAVLIVSGLVGSLAGSHGPPPDCLRSPLGSPSREGFGGPEFGELAPPPDDVRVLAEHMIAVVRGSYVEILETTAQGDVDDRVDLTAEQRRNGFPTRAWPVTVMRFRVTRYIVGDGPTELTVGQYGDFAANQYFSMPAPHFGQEITLIVGTWNLHPSINNAVYGSYGRLVDQGGRVCYAFVDDEAFRQNPFLESASVPFAGDMSLDELHEVLREAGRERGLHVPGD